MLVETLVAETSDFPTHAAAAAFSRLESHDLTIVIMVDVVELGGYGLNNQNLPMGTGRGQKVTGKTSISYCEEI